MQQIPKADLNEFLSDNKKQKESFVNKIGESISGNWFSGFKRTFSR